mgnify:CR=1 FL=1
MYKSVNKYMIYDFIKVLFTVENKYFKNDL